MSPSRGCRDVFRRTSCARMRICFGDGVNMSLIVNDSVLKDHSAPRRSVFLINYHQSGFSAVSIFQDKEGEHAVWGEREG